MKKIFPFIFFLLLFVSTTPVVHAALFENWDTYNGESCLENGVATLRCLPVVFHNVVSAFLLFVGAVAVFLIIWSGIKFVNSGGDPKKVEGARKVMTYAIIGAILVLSSFAILYFIGYVTKSTNCITNVNSVAKGGCQ